MFYDCLEQALSSSQFYEDMKVLVAAHPCSGTKFTHSILQKCGLDVGFESTQTHGAVSWFHITLLERMDFRHIFHQTRNPLSCISTSQEMDEEFLEYMGNFIYIPEKGSLPKFVRCAYSWIGWNRYIEGITSHRYSVENIWDIWGELCETLGIGGKLRDHAQLKAGPRMGNYQPVTFEELKEFEISVSLYEMAASYGYELR